MTVFALFRVTDGTGPAATSKTPHNAGTSVVIREGFAMNAVIPIPTLHSGTRISLRSSAALDWRGFGAELFSVAAGVHRIPAQQHHRIGIHIGTPVKAHCLCDERRHVRLQSPGDTDVIPAGLDGQWADESNCTILTVWFADAFVRRTFEQMALRESQAQIRPQFQMRDARFQHLAWALRAELEADALRGESRHGDDCAVGRWGAGARGQAQQTTRTAHGRVGG
jgi:hypothetical protein